MKEAIGISTCSLLMKKELIEGTDVALMTQPVLTPGVPDFVPFGNVKMMEHFRVAAKDA